MDKFYIYSILGIVSGVAIVITLLLIVLDKDFKGYTRQIPMPPKHLKQKKCQELLKNHTQKQKQ